jgi:hypothetical protein
MTNAECGFKNTVLYSNPHSAIHNSVQPAFTLNVSRQFVYSAASFG